IQPPDGTPIVVRDEPGASIPVPSADGATLYFIMNVRSNIFGYDYQSDREIRCARPEDGPADMIARIGAERVPGLPAVMYVTASPDGRWLAMPLLDGDTTNLWVLSTAGGELKQVTDFGSRSIEIARSIAWSADSRYVYAALAELETDLIVF